MYVDFGEKRGRVRFTWKELTATVSLAAALTYQVIDTQLKLAMCEKRVAKLEQITQGALAPKPEYRCGPPCGTGLEAK